MTYNIDDTVKLRSWDDLAKEFGEDNHGDIKIGEVWAFSSNKHRYGHLATIMEYANSLYRETYMIKTWDGHLMMVDIAEIDCVTGTVQAEAVHPTLTFADLYRVV